MQPDSLNTALSPIWILAQKSFQNNGFDVFSNSNVSQNQLLLSRQFDNFLGAKIQTTFNHWNNVKPVKWIA